MTRHLNNLERLFRKLNCRYGPDDPLSKQAQAEFEDSKSIEQIDNLQQDWSISYRCLIRDQHSEFMRHTRR